MDLDDFTKLLLAYLIVMNLLLTYSSSSYPDVRITPVLQEGAHLTASYRRRLLDVPVSEPSPSSPSDAFDNPDTLPRSHSLLSESIAATPPAPYTVLPHLITTSGRTSYRRLDEVPPPEPSPSQSNNPGTSPPTPPLPPSPPPSRISIAAPPLEQPNKKSSGKVIAVAVSIVIGAIFCFAGVFGWFLFRRKKKFKKLTDKETPNLDGPVSTGGAASGGGTIFDDSDSDPTSNDIATKLPKRYPYHTLALATSNFNEQNKLGEGGFGPVFKGILEDGKGEVAVKRVSKRAIGAPKQYKAEIKILTRLSHRNLIELFGWCDEDGEFLLVYKFMSNGCLNSQLYNKSRLLTWAERYNIVLGLASALNYLHEECEECVLHRDIKPGNILLDSSFNAKLSDFGLARLVDHDLSSKYTALAGTMEYMAPEHIQERRASKESDIYSLGVVLLEIACGRSPFAHKDDHSREVTNLIDLVWDHYGQKEILKVADKKLTGQYNGQQMECVMIVGLWCAHPISTERPTIGHAIKVLKFDAPLPELPPRRPHFLSLFAGLSQIGSSTGNSSSNGLSGSS